MPCSPLERWSLIYTRAAGQPAHWSKMLLRCSTCCTDTMQGPGLQHAKMLVKRKLKPVLDAVLGGDPQNQDDIDLFLHNVASSYPFGFNVASSYPFGSLFHLMNQYRIFLPVLILSNLGNNSA